MLLSVLRQTGSQHRIGNRAVADQKMAKVANKAS